VNAVQENLTELPDRRLDPLASASSWSRLFRELADGRSEALEGLWQLAARDMYGLALWRTGSREDAEDAVQDAFVRLAEQRDRLAAVRDPRAWTLTLVHRIAVDLTRRRARRAALPLEGCPYLQAETGDLNAALDSRRLSALLSELPAAQRTVVYLRHFTDCTFAAIGAVTGVPTFTAASRYRLGMRRLRRLMEEGS
jgi:RNA polymerase sigma-70 factor (ECF subfamily)